MNKFSRQNIMKGTCVIIGFLFSSVSILGIFFDVPNFGKLNGLGILVGVVFFISGILWHFFDLNHEINTLRSELPNILFGKPKHIEVDQRVNDYGANSFISKQISPKTPLYLFYIDFRNKPIIQKGNDALGVQALLEFYDENDDKRRAYFGRWIDMPERTLNENHRYTDISSDGRTEKHLGIAYISGEKGNTFYLLDSDVVDNAPEVMVLNPPFLLAGKYTLVVTVSGRNFPEPSPRVYEIQNLKDELLIFTERKDGVKWLQKIENDKKRLARIWPSVN